MGSDTCKRYKRLAVSGWEHNRGRGESKLREMKPDPIAQADASPTRPYLDVGKAAKRGRPGLGSSSPCLFVLIKKTKSIQGILLRLRQLRYSMKAQH